jgi:hypothetical protein
MIYNLANRIDPRDKQARAPINTAARRARQSSDEMLYADATRRERHAAGGLRIFKWSLCR